VKTVLHRIGTGEYFEAPDRWTTRPERAHNFKSIDRALSFIEKFRMKNVEVAFSFSNGEAVTNCPVERLRVEYCRR
jgi:hypothetical protein